MYGRRLQWEYLEHLVFLLKFVFWYVMCSRLTFPALFHISNCSHRHKAFCLICCLVWSGMYNHIICFQLKQYHFIHKNLFQFKCSDQTVFLKFCVFVLSRADATDKCRVHYQNTTDCAWPQCRPSRFLHSNKSWKLFIWQIAVIRQCVNIGFFGVSHATVTNVKRICFSRTP